MSNRTTLAAFALVLASSPLAAAAQTLTPDPLPPAEDGPGLIEEGLKRFFEGLVTEMEPALRDLGGTLQSYEPLMRELAALIGDLENYQSPERLPNGDIILRRKAGAPPPPPVPETGPRPRGTPPPGLTPDAPPPRREDHDDEEAIDL